MSNKTFKGAWHCTQFDWGNFPAPCTDEKEFSNSIGQRMVLVEPHDYRRGGGDWEKHPDAQPTHKCYITKPYYIADEPVKQDIFEEFYQEKYGKASDTTNYHGYVLGVNWFEAAEFCKWLSNKEEKLYRLPTEAEWEAAARKSTELNIDRMCDTHIREWCFDWYDAYTDLDQNDPAGPATGMCKVIRGGYLDNPARYNEHNLDLWWRASLPPTYRHYHEDTHNEFGRHIIGFRIACGEMPVTSEKHPTNQVCMNIHQTAVHLEAAPDAKKPYFRKRHVFPTPPDNAPSEEIRAVGFNHIFRHHHHSPALTVCPNGDLLYSVYSSYKEYDAEVGLAGTRLRHGCDEWEQPDIFINPVGVNDHAPNLYTDSDGTIYHFWGWQQLTNSFPFQYVYSTDNGETWSEVQFPFFKDTAERVVRQPINSCLRDEDGTFYVASDAAFEPGSVLWRTRDNMKTWENPKGRTAGRHSTFVHLNDGSILAMGGKNSDIDGYMPQAISKDKGDTWEVSKTPFPMQFSGQRPCIIRLKSGRLFMCGDYQNKKGQKPDTIKEGGSYGAYSDDDGKTWTMKKLWGTQKQKKSPNEFGGQSTLGYSVCRQTEDGMIHVITSNNRPLLHFEFNEEWLISHEGESPSDEVLMKSHATKIVSDIETFEEHYEDGSIRCKWSGGIADDGRFLLEGEDIFYYPDGEIMTKGEYHLGKRIGEYVYFDEDGFKVFQWNHTEDGFDILTTYYPGSNNIKTRARFKDKKAEGLAQTFGRKKGNVTGEYQFENGIMISKKDLKKEEPSPIGEIF